MENVFYFLILLTDEHYYADLFLTSKNLPNPFERHPKTMIFGVFFSSIFVFSIKCKNSMAQMNVQIEKKRIALTEFE